MAAPMQFAYRTLKGIGIVNAAPVYESLPGFERPGGNLRCCTYSPCGRYFAWASPDQVAVIDASVGSIITTLPTSNVYELGFSPQGSYLITWERPSKDADGNASKNLKVWRVVERSEGDRRAMGQFVQKSQTGWNLQYTSDERFCARTVTNEVQFYDSGDFGTVWNKLRVEGVTDFAISPGKNHSVAVFIPERKGQPATVKVFNVPHFTSAVSQKTFFKGDKVQLKWNDQGTSLIVLAQTEVDKTGKSYYGETNLYILGANGGFDSRVQLDKEGPIHDVTWSPNSREFGVVYGYMPAKATIFNERAVPTHEFPLKPRNTILFSPNAHFVLVAGFGNLAGQMDIYDLEQDYAKITTVEATNPSVCEWSPDGRYILTATTSPRLRVDNGVRIWHVSGGLMYNEDLNELYHVCWRPQPSALLIKSNPLHPLPAPHHSALTYLGTVKTPSKPAGAYRPPGARGQVTPLHFKREDEGGAAHISNGAAAPYGGGVANGFGKARRREVPGAEAASDEHLPPGAAPGGGVSLVGVADNNDEGLSKAALKNKKKREAKKAKERGEEQAAELSTNLHEGREWIRGGNQAQADSHPSQAPQGAAATAASVASPTTPSKPTPPHPASAPSTGTPSTSTSTITTTTTSSAAAAAEAAAAAAGLQSPREKKIRGLLKKVRAIDDLKMRLAAGEKLEDTQMKKIASEDGVRKELDGLGFVAD
ncbi:MAG: hypothetical protein M1838_003804 [Thelocarpon superellum]|nr:MAG: hypothetical protein M1838_003804 [Thelocarpon superellum]